VAVSLLPEADAPGKTAHYQRAGSEYVTGFVTGTTLGRSLEAPHAACGRPAAIPEATELRWPSKIVQRIYRSGLSNQVEKKRMVPTDAATRRLVQSPKGDHAAFEALIREHQRMIYSLCYRMSGSAADAEDLAQETFIQAYQHLDAFRGEAGVWTWLYRIAVNLCLNWRKREQRRVHAHQEWSEQEPSTPGENAGRTQQVQEALLKLAPKQRAAVILTTYDGLTHAEAAAALDCSETTVSWRLFAARAKLKRLLKDPFQTGASQ
jgi:RNA polymerase sigma-70 factor, ECF subfamily